MRKVINPVIWESEVRSQIKYLYMNKDALNFDEREYIQDIGLSWCDICGIIELKDDLIKLQDLIPNRYKELEGVVDVCDVCAKTKIERVYKKRD